MVNIHMPVEKIMDLFKSKSEKKSRVGIDIGSYAVKTVELFRERDNLKIKNLAYARLEYPGSKDNLLRAIKESAARANVLNRQVNIAVSGPSVIVRFIELPNMTAEELKNAIPFEAEKYIPFNIEEVILDHQLLIPRHGGESKMLVLLVAAKKSLINERLKLIDEANLSVGILDVASFANVNAFLKGPKRIKDGVTALVDIGAKATDINILDSSLLCFARSIQLGGNNITKAISDSLSIDLKSAEKMKIDPGDRAVEINEKINSILHNIIDEMRLSFSYYENQSGKAVESVFLTGGGSRIKNFDNMLRENLGMEIGLWDPTEGLELDPSIDRQSLDSIKDQLGVAIGLALR